MRTGRNDQCPCGNGKKFKKCCFGKISWESIGAGTYEHLDNLSVKGKNVAFLNSVINILDLDPSKTPFNWGDLKKKVTVKVVRDIHESLLSVWPSFSNYESVLRREEQDLSSLYVGNYHHESILRGVKRHSLYCDTIYLIDPFIYPTSVNPAYNPVLVPEKYISDTLSCLNIWFTLFPWVRDGLVKFIRTPGDFLPGLNGECLRLADKRRNANQELQDLLKNISEDDIPDKEDFKQYMTLSFPNEILRERIRELYPNLGIRNVDDIMEHIGEIKENHPYIVPAEIREYPQNEFRIMRSGASFDMAKSITDITGSHFVTDLPYKWKEIEIERSRLTSNQELWSPFSKAFKDVKIKYLENVSLEYALRLRKENRLDDLRMFFRKVWLTSKSQNPFSDQNIDTLVVELDQKIREAQYEWSKIDQDLLKWFSTAGPAIAGLGAMTGAGQLSWLGPVISGASSLIDAKLKRNSFSNRFPAALLLKTEK